MVFVPLMRERELERERIKGRERREWNYMLCSMGIRNWELNAIISSTDQYCYISDDGIQYGKRKEKGRG